MKTSTADAPPRSRRGALISFAVLMAAAACSAGRIGGGEGSDAGSSRPDASFATDTDGASTVDRDIDMALADGSPRDQRDPAANDGGDGNGSGAGGTEGGRSTDGGGRDQDPGRDAPAADVPGADSSVQDGGVVELPNGDRGTPTDMSAGDGVSPQERPGTFVGVGYGGRRIRSTDDGLTWVDDVAIAANGGDDNNLLRTVTWGDGQFVALGFRVMTSPNGRDWHDYGAVIGQWIGAAAPGPTGGYVGVGGFGLRATSPDGVTWTHHDIDTIATHADSGAALIFAADRGGRFVSTNDSGRRSVSSDGTTWVYSSGATAALTTALAFGNGVHVGIGGAGVVVSSDGGVTWSDAAQLAASVTGLVHAQGHFTATASGRVFTSADGRTWTDRPVAGLTPGRLTYGHGTYINVAGLQLRRSSDGIVWAPPVVLSGTNAIQCVTFGPTG